MSSTAGEIIAQAFREPNFTPIGHTTTAEEIAEAIPRLNNLLSAFFGVELGDPYRDWPLGDNWTAPQELRHPLTPITGNDVALTTDPWAYPPENSRLVVAITTPRTIFFPAAPNDGARMAYVDAGSTADLTIDGGGRLVQGVPSISGQGGTRQWFYRADLANWTCIQRIVDETTVLPLPEEFDDLFVAGLAVSLAPRFGVAIDPTIAERYSDMLARAKLRYKPSEKRKSAAELRTLQRTVP